MANDDQFVLDCLREAALQQNIASEATKKAAKLRELAKLYKSKPSGDGEKTTARPAIPEGKSIRQLVQSATSKSHRTVPEICKTTKLGRKQVTHAIHAQKSEYDKRIRESEKRPEFKFKGKGR